MGKLPKNLSWSRLDIETKKLYVRLLREDGHSDSAIGSFFGTTKNAVVGFRHSHLTDLTGAIRATASEVNLERFRNLLQTYEMRKLEVERGVSTVAPVSETVLPPWPDDAIPRPHWPDARFAWEGSVVPKHQLTARESMQCVWGMRVPGMRRCGCIQLGDSLLCTYHKRAYDVFVKKYTLKSP